MSSAAVLADAVLVLHAAVVLFVVGGLVLVLAGNAAGWRWVNAWPLRLAHLGAIAWVVVQSWLGADCPLTTLEMRLRAAAGEAVHGQGFVAHWLQRLLYYDAPPWAFVVAYTVFGVAVAAAWWRYPPRRRAPARA
jgi:hypothetical protein